MQQMYTCIYIKCMHAWLILLVLSARHKCIVHTYTNQMPGQLGNFHFVLRLDIMHNIYRVLLLTPCRNGPPTLFMNLPLIQNVEMVKPAIRLWLLIPWWIKQCTNKERSNRKNLKIVLNILFISIEYRSACYLYIYWEHEYGVIVEAGGMTVNAGLVLWVGLEFYVSAAILYFVLVCLVFWDSVVRCLPLITGLAART